MASQRGALKALGPGFLFAAVSIGVSHLVQSTRAGAGHGLTLVVVIVVAMVLKYPLFEFGHRYAAATGTSLLEGYRKQGKWTLVVYLGLTLGTMFTVLAAVTAVTAALAIQLTSPIPGDESLRYNYNTWPGRGNYPTSAWPAGRVIADNYRFARHHGHPVDKNLPDSHGRVHVLAVLEREAAADVSRDWKEALAAELEAMESDRYRLAWQDGLPEAIASSLKPYRDRLDSSYSRLMNTIEISMEQR